VYRTCAAFHNTLIHDESDDKRISYAELLKMGHVGMVDISTNEWVQTEKNHMNNIL
jgi:hypothetical protein